MVNKCALNSCERGYIKKNQNKGNFSSFHFPLENSELLIKWERFTNRRDWRPTKHSVLCDLHFDEKFISRGKRCTLKWDMQPVPTIYPKDMLERPLILPTPQSKRKLPTQRNFYEDELETFRLQDQIRNFEMLNESHSPEGYSCKKTEECIVFFNLVFDDSTGFPHIFESIKVDKNLHVQLQYNGNPMPLPAWFTKGRDATLSRLSMLHNLPSYIRNVCTGNSILDEMKNRMHYKPKGRPPYSAAMIRYALHLRHTSLQAYKLLLEKFPLPSISLLHKIQQGGVDALKAVRRLREGGSISADCVLMADEMYLQKGTQYQGGQYVGADEDENLYKGVVVFMIVGLKESIPYVVQAVPEVTITGDWLSEKISKCLISLGEAGFIVRGIVTDNHSANVNAFSYLRKKYGNDSELFIRHPSNNGKNTYMFFDSVHLIKNIRNNLLNCKKFVFPPFEYVRNGISIHCPAGYICWSNFHRIYEKDANLMAGLKKARKLTYQSLHPGNNKQDVNLALSIFDESTIAAVRSYFPERTDIAEFLTIIRTWWTIANSKQRYSPNALGNAIVIGDGKTDYFTSLADWIEEWQKCPAFTLTPHTSSALILTLRAHS